MLEAKSDRSQIAVGNSKGLPQQTVEMVSGFEYLADDCSCETGDDTEHFFSDDESLMDELEERIDTFSKLSKIPALAVMISDMESFKIKASVSHRRSSLQHLSSAVTHHEAKMKRSASALYYRNNEVDDDDDEEAHLNDEEEESGESPWDFLLSQFEKNGKTSTNSLPVAHDEVPKGFFIPMKPTNFTSFNGAIAQAVRKGDLESFVSIHKSGKPLICCNKFKETTIHTICRCGHESLLEYALDQSKSCIRVVDDLGRTPLHDACWTDSPNFDIVRMIILTCPDMLYIADNRGFTPLEYVVNAGLWPAWRSFLEENQELLCPQELA